MSPGMLGWGGSQNCGLRRHFSSCRNEKNKSRQRRQGEGEKRKKKAEKRKICITLVALTSSPCPWHQSSTFPPQEPPLGLPGQRLFAQPPRPSWPSRRPSCWYRLSWDRTWFVYSVNNAILSGVKKMVRRCRLGRLSLHSGSKMDVVRPGLSVGRICDGGGRCSMGMERVGMDGVLSSMLLCLWQFKGIRRIQGSTSRVTVSSPVPSSC